jgi:BirA family biotin operon repressor/biotin-[acetyl-CoA-carboxylase] ligase
METGREWSRVQLAAALLRALDREYRQLEQAGGREQLFRRFEAASSYARGLRVNVDEDGGYNGITEGLDPRGFLQVRADNGKLKTVLSGGVREL